MSNVLISAIQPSGKPHIGNYFGAMRQFVSLQKQYDSYIFIADLHSLTSLKSKDELAQNTLDVAIDYLTLGLDPEHVTLYTQSSVPEVTELAWILSCSTTMPFLMRAHAFKDAEAKNKDINVGKFSYPILMAADILIQSAAVVPVGKDQKQHIEITRDIAEKFNHTFGETFVIPEAYIQEETQTVPGIDGQKMSKSYNNTIGLFASDEEIRASVMSIATDSKGVNEPKDPETSVLFQIHKLLLTETQRTELASMYTSGGLGYKEAKERLIADLIQFISPLRETRARFVKDPNLVKDILRMGGEKARTRAIGLMNHVRGGVGLLDL